jgi:hypothetical protein
VNPVEGKMIKRVRLSALNTTYNDVTISKTSHPVSGIIVQGVLQFSISSTIGNKNMFITVEVSDNAKDWRDGPTFTLTNQQSGRKEYKFEIKTSNVRVRISVDGTTAADTYTLGQFELALT